jgi:type I restriction-modification system DNA methylase subunit
MLPRHAASLVAGDGMAEDTEDVAALWARVRERYQKREAFEHFSRAFGTLLASTDEIRDVLGQVYMTFAYPNPGSGQFFTPWDVARMMAEMNAADAVVEIRRRVDSGQPFEPVSILDPCCGSGTMLLAFASCVPRELLQYVSFFGQDIDMTCVRMARINCRLYGLNGGSAARNTTIVVDGEPSIGEQLEGVAGTPAREARPSRGQLLLAGV